MWRTNILLTNSRRVFSITDSAPIETKGMDAKKAAEVSKVYTPSAKDITKEQAADKIAAKIVEITGSDLSGYTSVMQLFPIKERDTWFGSFTSADGKTIYSSKIDAVTGEVWSINMFVRAGGGYSEKAGGTCDLSKDLLNNSADVFGYDIEKS
ncbi:hypothetical protein DEAC_c39300 [Desulfosporosinus acididurans]|uniref:Uncharacterized protein n=2 Tax=Desulfosporosinus acididurans TaxID=476652 RepID=A0A0J1FKV3_9FIRM|nr:hypothetical protein DEAC_c39300 [Desulfosporosinus acididurans]